MEALWTEKVALATDVLGLPPRRLLRPEPAGARTRVDLMWDGRRLGIRGPTRSDGSFQFTELTAPEVAAPAVLELIAAFLDDPPPLGPAQVRFRSGDGALRGIWIDASRESLAALVAEAAWLAEREAAGTVVELGYRGESQPRTWLPSFDRDGRTISLECRVSSFTQPGPSVNRALIEMLFALADLMGMESGSWCEWGAGYGNLTAALATGLPGPGWACERDRTAAELLERNRSRCFPAVAVEHRSAEAGPPGPARLWVIDPPRPGFGALLAGLNRGPAARPEWILALHCHATGLHLDSRILGETGYRLAGWGGLDAFPGSAHLEVVSMWKRGS